MQTWMRQHPQTGEVLGVASKQGPAATGMDITIGKTLEVGGTGTMD